MEERIVQIARNVLKSGNKILVVGINSKNLGKWYHVNDSRLVFWNSKDARKNVPKGVGLVLITRWNDHSSIDHVRASVSDETVFYSKFVSTGDLKRLLEKSYVPLVATPTSALSQPTQDVVLPVAVESLAVVDEPAVPNENSFVDEKKEEEEKMVDTPVVEVEVKPQQERGTVTNFVRKYADRETRKPANEICRLVALATGMGIQATEASIKNAFYNMRSKIAKKAKTGVASASTTQVFAPVEIPSVEREDSVQLLEKFTGDIDLVRVAIREVLVERESLRQQNESLRQQIESLQAQLDECKSTSADSRRVLEEALSKLR